jgi:hypothetical protein
MERIFFVFVKVLSNLYARLLSGDYKSFTLIVFGNIFYLVNEDATKLIILFL